MSGNLIDLRKRIKAVNNTKKIFQAMKSVSAAKLRRSVTDVQRNLPMMEKIKELLARVGQGPQGKSNPFLQERNSGDRLVIVLSSDKGLCGSFNSHVMDYLDQYYEELLDQGESPALITAGNRVFKHVRKKGYNLKKNFPSMMSRLSHKEAFELSQYVQKIYLEGEIKKVEFLYTNYISASKQEVGVRTLFPIQKEWGDGDTEGNKEIEYIFEPSVDEIFERLLPLYINLFVYRVLLESAASEHGARMVAMDLASRNAGEMIRTLTLTMNKLRQASITTELLEIITATEALNK